MSGIHSTLEVLRDAEKPLTAAAIRSLSDITKPEMIILAAHWETIPNERRHTLIARFGELTETNFDLNFSAVTEHALNDQDEDIRREAVEALWYDEEPSLLRKLITLARKDVSDGVREAAVSAIGRFILLGELGKIGPTLAKDAQDLALALYNDVDETIEIRRRAIEALGNCTRQGVADLIQEAYDSDDSRMQASALHAMGSSCDPDWGSVILDELRSEEPEMRYEAAHAAGELQLEEAIPALAELLEDEDREIRESAVWALGEVGGSAARTLLENAHENAELAGDEEMVDAIQEALESASLVGEDLLID